jgi:hypothetical protein
MKHAASVRCPPSRVGSRAQIGLAVTAVATARHARATPTSSAVWARSARRFARAGVWALPGYAVAYGVATLGEPHGELAAGSSLFRADRPNPSLAGFLAIWLGLVALVALTALLAAARGRRTAAVGLLAGLAGAAVLLPLSGVPADTPMYGATASDLANAGAALHSAGWLMLGWAVVRCRLLNRADGVLLMIAAPLVGVVGQLVGQLQTVGALLLLAGGIGVAWSAARLQP